MVTEIDDTESSLIYANAMYQAATAGSKDRDLANKGQMYFDAGNYTSAYHCFNDAIKINPNEAYYFYMRGACSGNSGNYEAAVSDLRKALSLSTDNVSKSWCWYDMAIAYAGLGDENQAKNCVINAARLGHVIAQDLCKSNGIPY